MSNNKVFKKKPELIEFTKLGLAYLLFAGLFVRTILSSEFLTLSINFERNLIIYFSTTTMITTLIIAIAPHKMINNGIRWRRYRNDKHFGKLRKKVSTTYPVMRPTLNELWGSIFLTLIFLYLLISIIISKIVENLEIGKTSIIYLIRKSIGFISSSTNLDNVETVIDSQSSILILIIGSLIGTSLFLMKGSSSWWKEFDRRLKYSLLLGYIKDADYGYEEMHERFIKQTEKISEEARKILFDPEWTKKYEEGLEKGHWTKVDRLYWKQKKKIKDLLAKLENTTEDKKPDDKLEIERLCLAIKLNGILPILSLSSPVDKKPEISLENLKNSFDKCSSFEELIEI